VTDTHKNVLSRRLPKENITRQLTT
jgi:hypothetical protein